MKKFKIYFILFSLVFLTGCFQSTALLAPSFTVATSGNLLQAGLHYSANTAIKKETGSYPLEHIKNSVEDNKSNKIFHTELKNFLEKKIEITRKKLLSN